MDSDGSHDSSSSSSSDSENENQNNAPTSPRSRSHSPTNSQNQSPKSRRSNSPQSVNSFEMRPGSTGPASPNNNQYSPNREDVKSRNSSMKSRNSSIKSRSQSRNSEHESIKSVKSRSNSRNSDQGSIKSNKSRHSNKSRNSNRSSSSDRESVASGDSNKSSSSHKSGNSSDSSASSRGSKRHKSFSSNTRPDTQPEEISDGEMELDVRKDSEDEAEPESEKKIENLQISHEDLSDVSDLDSIGGDRSDDDEDEEGEEKTEEEIEKKIDEPIVESIKSPPTDLRLKLDEAVKIRKETPKLPEKTSKTEDCEEALDFEAEDGECVDDSKEENGELGESGDVEELPQIVEKKPPEDLEEGEVTDDEETRPEETEPRPVCRFYSRGQCTWGASCRFLHPGVTDKGNYTMFEMIRPVVPGPALIPGFPAPEFRDERAFGHPAIVRPEPPPAESAWERGLRTAKEMVRRAIKRKEQDMDFEEKKMNLTLAQDELDKENGYYTRAASPVLVEPAAPLPPPVKHYVPRHDPYYPPPTRHPEEYYRRVHHYDPVPAVPVRQVRIEPEYEPPPTRERVHSYRELPTHRMPDYYNDKYEERTVTMSATAHKRPHRPKREVVVQRADAPGPGRGDEWADPWMRSKSPGARGARTGPRRQSYSSGSSYSSSSSTRSSSASSRSTSYRRRHRSRSRSRSGSAGARTRRRAPATSPTPQSYRREGSRRRRGVVSPSVIVSERKAAHERASLMNPPAPRKTHKDTRPPSPGMMRTSAQNPPAPIKVPSTDQFGRTTKREVDRITSERRNLDPDRKKAVVAALAAKVRGHATKSSRSSSASDSSGSSSSDSESSYSSSNSSREESGKRKVAENRMELAALAMKTKTLESIKGERGATEPTGKKRPAGSPPAGETAAKVATVSKSSAAPAGNGGKKATSRREELLKQLKAVEDAIAKKRSKIN